MKKELIKTSKFISLVLRHKPEAAGITLDKEGWVSVDVLIGALNKKDKNINREILDEIVATNNKKRFAYNENKTKIRASQGHSIDVDLGFKPVEPPKVLYHGTATRNLTAIFANGLSKMKRQHVHLSKDVATAKNVGSRHGTEIVLTIDAGQMHKDGIEFYLSENGVWLTNQVDKKYIKLHHE